MEGHEPDTVEITILNFGQQEQTQESQIELEGESETHWCRGLDVLVSTAIRWVRFVWSFIPVQIRGPNNASEVFSTFIRRLKINDDGMPRLSCKDFESTLKTNNVSLVLAYKCDEHLKRDLKKIKSNPKVAEISQTYPLCPLSNYSAYYKRNIREHLPKTYSVYLLLFGRGVKDDIYLLDIYKPIDEDILIKVKSQVTKFQSEETEQISKVSLDPSNQSNQTNTT